MTSGGRARHRKKGEGAKQAARIAATFLITTFLPPAALPPFRRRQLKLIPEFGAATICERKGEKAI